MLPLGLLLAAAIQASPPPRVMLWSWETPADLRFLRPDRAGVAFLAATFLLEGDQVRSRPRQNPVRTSQGAYLMATMRIEISKRRKPSYSSRQRRQLADSIAKVVQATGVKAAQLDFDVPKSGRSLYRALIPEVRAKIGANVFLSLTALASWCEDGDWLTTVGADEIVPMLFRMGPGGPAVRERLRKNGQFSSPACRASVGLDSSEPDAAVLGKGHPRVYLLIDWRRQTPESIGRLLQELSAP
jgi:hypothetical protein